jgi:hypothetical protein
MLRAPQTEWTKVNIESVLHCPHQLPAKEDQRDDLPTLLGPSPVKVNPVLKSNLLSPSPCITLLGASNNVSMTGECLKTCTSRHAFTCSATSN